MFPPPPAPPKSQAGAKLIQAGQKQKQTAGRIQSASKRVRFFANNLNSNHRLVKTTEAMRTGLTAIRNILSPVQTTLNSVHDALDGIKVPKIEFSTTNIPTPVGSIRVVTGITIDNTKPFLTAAGFFGNMADQVSDLRGSLQEMKTSLTELLDYVPQMREGLRNFADDLQDAADNLDATGDALIEAGGSAGSPPSYP